MTLPLPKTCKVANFKYSLNSWNLAQPSHTELHQQSPRASELVPGSHTYPLRPKSKSSNITTAINYTSCCYHRNIVTLQWIHYTWNQCHQSNLQHFSPQNYSSKYSKTLLKQLLCLLRFLSRWACKGCWIPRFPSKFGRAIHDLMFLRISRFIMGISIEKLFLPDPGRDLRLQHLGQWSHPPLLQLPSKLLLRRPPAHIHRVSYTSS